MQYTYEVVLHNAASITIQRACQLADIIQNHIDSNGTHVQGVGLDKQSDVVITIETDVLLEDLFNVIYEIGRASCRERV